MIVSSLLPVFGLILLGSVLKHFALTDEAFLKAADKLVYFVFFPVLLFWKIGGAQSDSSFSWSLCISVIFSIASIFLVSAAVIKLLKIPNYQAGSFSQSCYRGNAYIGMAIVFNALGDEGAENFGILIGFIVPFINVLAVSSLIWYSGLHYSFQARSRLTAKEIISNPLIIACVAGILYSRTINDIPDSLENAFDLLSSAAVPLALVSVGGALTFRRLKRNLSLSLVSSIIKLLFLPMIGWGCLELFGVTGTPFKVGLIFFALPAAASLYILSSQLDSDTELASSSIMISTLLSFLPLSVVLHLI